MLSKAQKIIEKTIPVDTHVSTVIVDLEHVFSIRLKSAKENKIALNAISEGEYAPHFIVTEQSYQNTINVSGNIAFTFPDNQDKLSAHKVHAITVELTVPENLNIIINNNIGHLHAIGYYQTLVANSISGNCTLNDVSGNVTIQTVDGDIYLAVKSGKVSAESQTGIVNLGVLTGGNSVFELKTIKGNINIEQSK